MSDSTIQFERDFEALTGKMPFPWQRRLYGWFSQGKMPAAVNLPTGLGKTSIIAIWLLARAHGANLPRRLVYVVNRRTVVDQTTVEVEGYKRKNIRDIDNFAISTLRGQHADNREWCADPSRPAIICGTVDMIGSRLLFSGYGIGSKARPLHAGFLGQDVLLIHDEAHLEPAFQKLIEAIETEQERCKEFAKFHVMELTATSRGNQDAFTLNKDDRDNETIKARIHATKELHLEPLKDSKNLADQVAYRALQFKDSGLAILVFVHTVEDVLKVRDQLPKGQVVTLTGTMRGKERDELVESSIFQRFLPNQPEGVVEDVKKTVFLVCTSAGEVGVNISADHQVCDLSTFESMAQRFGRVNRFGEREDTEIHVIHPNEFDEKDDYEKRRELTLELLKNLSGDASPHSLGKLDAKKCIAAYAPEPVTLPTSDILFDAWALTTIRGRLPGRPPVEPYLHGLPTEWQPPETNVAWREEVGRIDDELREKYKPETLLDEYPLKPHELLREPSYRAFKHFQKLAELHEGKDVPVWLLDEDGSIEVLSLVGLAGNEHKERINWKTVILPPSVGGLEGGMLIGNSPIADDVADTEERRRVWNDESNPEGMRRILSINFSGMDDDEVAETWRWFEKTNEGAKAAKLAVQWDVHVKDVERETVRIADALPLSDALKQALKIAAKFHDHGKRRSLFQRVLGNCDYPRIVLAKSGSKKGETVQIIYRHEFGSLLDVEKEDLGELTDLVLHLISAHHGRARPHFPTEEVFDPERSQAVAERIASEVPRRFARLQRKYGRWGLAYLESLLRAGDWAASSSPSAYVQEGEC